MRPPSAIIPGAGVKAHAPRTPGNITTAPPAPNIRTKLRRVVRCISWSGQATTSASDLSACWSAIPVTLRSGSRLVAWPATGDLRCRGNRSEGSKNTASLKAEPCRINDGLPACRLYRVCVESHQPGMKRGGSCGRHRNRRARRSSPTGGLQ